MTYYIIRRILWIIPLLFIVITVCFVLVRVVPGGPFDRERKLPSEIEKNIKARYDLDKPVIFNSDRLSEGDVGGAISETQYFRYLKRIVLHFDFGPSLKHRNHTVNDIIDASFPISVSLGVFALIFALLLGISAGVIGAIRQNSLFDYASMGCAIIGISAPNFVIGSILLLIFVFWLPIFPSAGWGEFKNLILPGITLSLPFAARFARLTRTGMLEVINQDFIRTAKAKGLKERIVIARHALKGALLPVVSFLGPATAGILTGSLVIEKIFAVPGVGSLFVNSAFNRDYPVVIGTVILYFTLLAFFNLAVDIAYAYLDPRIRYE